MDAPESSASAPAAAGPATPFLADGTRRSLDPRVVDLDRLIGGIVTPCVSAGLLIVLGIFYAATSPPTWLFALLLLSWAAVSASLVWQTIRWPEIEYRHASYMVNEQGIEIARGVIWRSIVSVPGSRVQHTDVSQGPLQRRYGLGTLTIYTAGTEYARVNLQGLAHATALAIRDHLLPKRSDDGV